MGSTMRKVLPRVIFFSAPCLLQSGFPSSPLQNGDNSYDPEGSRLTYQWTQVSGPPVSLDDHRSPDPSFLVEEPESEIQLVFQLVVDDGREKSEADEVMVTLLPSPSAPHPSYAPIILLPVVMRQ
jgi:large repetitive protein